MFDEKKMTEIFEASLQRLNIESNPEKASQKDAWKVTLIKSMITNVIVGMILLDTDEVLEVIRVTCDMLQLMWSESTDKK